MNDDYLSQMAAKHGITQEAVKEALARDWQMRHGPKTRLEQRAEIMPSYPHEAGILDVCQQLHSSQSGSSDPLPEYVENKMRDFLRCCLTTWEETPLLSFRAFDCAVENLILVTLSEKRE